MPKYAGKRSLEEMMAAEMAKAERAQKARAEGKRLRVFNWNMAAEIIREKGVIHADAGLSEDWYWTAATILKEGKPVADALGPYLASIWATPTLRYTDAEGNEIDVECWLPADECGWDDATRWPDSARRIAGFQA